MGEQIIKQPDGKLAVFSSTVDDFIVWDATPEELIEWRAEWPRNGYCLQRSDVEAVLAELDKVRELAQVRADEILRLSDRLEELGHDE